MSRKLYIVVVWETKPLTLIRFCRSAVSWQLRIISWTLCYRNKSHRWKQFCDIVTQECEWQQMLARRNAIIEGKTFWYIVQLYSEYNRYILESKKPICWGSTGFCPVFAGGNFDSHGYQGVDKYLKAIIKIFANIRIRKEVIFLVTVCFLITLLEVCDSRKKIWMVTTVGTKKQRVKEIEKANKGQ